MLCNLRALLFLIAAAALASVVPAQAADLIAERAWFEDKSGALSIEQVKQQEFTPYSGVLSRGISPAALWVRLRIDPDKALQRSGQPQSDLYLKISPVYLDKVELFDPIDASGHPRVTGDQYPVARDDFRSLTLGFLIPKGSQARDIYLRVESTSTRFVFAEALEVIDLLESERQLRFLSGVFTGVGCLLFVWGLVSWLIAREGLLLSYSFAQIAGLVFGVSLLGQVRYFLGDTLSPVVIDNITSYSVVGAVGLATLFYWRLFREFSPPRWGSLILQSIMGIQLLAAVMITIGLPRVGIFMNWLVVSTVPPFCFALVFFCKGWIASNPRAVQLLPKNILILYFGMIFIVTFVSAMGGLGIYDSGRFAIYSGLANTMVSGLLAFAVLQYRSSLNQKAQARIASDLAVARELAGKEREYRLDQERLLTMLAHEVKTPLAVISMALGTQSQPEKSRALMKSAVRDIRDIIDQCLEADTLNAARLSLKIQEVFFEETLEDALSRIPGLKGRIKLQGLPGQSVHTDPRLFRIILFNLLDNAERYGDPSRPIEVAVSAEQLGSLEITVANAPGAVGLPDPNQLFQKYYRSTGAQRISGTGLGLYLSHQLAEKLGGSLRYAAINSQPTFTLCIPSLHSPD